MGLYKTSIILGGEVSWWSINLNILTKFLFVQNKVFSDPVDPPEYFQSNI